MEQNYISPHKEKVLILFSSRASERNFSYIFLEFVTKGHGTKYTLYVGKKLGVRKATALYKIVCKMEVTKRLTA